MPAFFPTAPELFVPRVRARCGGVRARFGRVLAVLAAGGAGPGAWTGPGCREADAGAERGRAAQAQPADRQGPQDRQRGRAEAGQAVRCSCARPSSASSRRRKELDEIRAQRLAVEARVRELEAEQARRVQELDGERAELAGELRTAYVNGREEQLKLLLNQEDPSNFGRMLAYYGYFGRARADAHPRHPGPARAPGAGPRKDRGREDPARVARATARAARGRPQGVTGQARAGRERHRPADQGPGRRAEAAAVPGEVSSSGSSPSCARPSNARSRPSPRARAVRRAPWRNRLRSSPCAASCRGRCRTGRSLPGSASRARVARCAGRAC